ncbi:MAG: hypothetical protein GX361_00675 [Bacteroidales bacterium]|nr:hypothetical protein [Bacteroidales bacterium]
MKISSIFVQCNASILKTPTVRFFPKSDMLNAAKKVKVKVINPYTDNEPGSEPREVGE